jgi:hypothetical protein
LIVTFRNRGISRFPAGRGIPDGIDVGFVSHDRQIAFGRGFVWRVTHIAPESHWLRFAHFSKQAGTPLASFRTIVESQLVSASIDARLFWRGSRVGFVSLDSMSARAELASFGAFCFNRLSQVAHQAV